MSDRPRTKPVDDNLREALQKLRHASFALAAASASQIPEDRDLAEEYLKEAARRYVRTEELSGRK